MDDSEQSKSSNRSGDYPWQHLLRGSVGSGSSSVFVWPRPHGVSKVQPVSSRQYGKSITQTITDHIDFTAAELRMMSYCYRDTTMALEAELLSDAMGLAEEINREPLKLDDLLAMNRPKCGRGGMVDALVLGTSSSRSEGSSPFARTTAASAYLPFEMDNKFVAELLRNMPVVAQVHDCFTIDTKGLA